MIMLPADDIRPWRQLVAKPLMRCRDTVLGTHRSAICRVESPARVHSVAAVLRKTLVVPQAVEAEDYASEQRCEGPQRRADRGTLLDLVCGSRRIPPTGELVEVGRTGHACRQ
jgi:hypothetical protein